MKSCWMFLIAACLISPLVKGQVELAPQVVSSAGGYHESDNITISWTLGELAITTLSGGGMLLTQGFQQPFDVGVGLPVNRVNWSISVFPNPVGNQLSIRFDLNRTGDYLLEVQDVTGRLITRKLYREVDPGDVVVINTSGYTEGVYFLKVLTPERYQVQVTSLRKL